MKKMILVSILSMVLSYEASAITVGEITLKASQINLNTKLNNDWTETMKINQIPDLVDNFPICMIDSGLNNTLDVFQGITIEGRFNTVGAPWNTDTSGHGTHLASLIVQGLGSKVTIYMNRVTNSINGENNVIRYQDIMDAMEQCVNQGAKVINLSVSGPISSSDLRNVVNRISYQHDTLIIASAGNHGTSTPNDEDAPYFPASLLGVISIGAINNADKNYSRAEFSPRNAYVNFVVPGINISGVVSDGMTVEASGTSQAAAIFTLAVAKLWSNFPEKSREEILMALYNTATDLGDKGKDIEYGFGLPNIKAAYDLLSESLYHKELYCSMHVNVWDPNKQYTSEMVIHDGTSYQAKWYTKGDIPKTQNSPWLKHKKCQMSQVQIELQQRVKDNLVLEKFLVQGSDFINTTNLSGMEKTEKKLSPTCNGLNNFNLDCSIKR